MGEPLWDLSKIDPSEQRVLSEKERQFLMTGDAGTYTNAEMERRIDVKTEKIPERVQQLIDDVSLLFYQGRLDDINDEIWQQLLSISNRSQVVRDEPVVRTASQQLGPEVDLGFELGSVLQMIHKEPVPSALVWGAIIGLVGESSSNWEREAENLVELFNELEAQYESRLVSAGTEAFEDDGFREEQDEIREVLRTHGFAPAPQLVDAVLREYTTGQSGAQPARPEKPSSSEPDPAEHPEPPSERTSAEDVRQTNLESIVSRFADQTRLRNLDRLAKDLREDAIRIQNQQWRGVDPDRAFCFVGNNGKTQIQEFDQTESKGQNNMTTVLRRLSYDDSTWVNRPVLSETEDGSATWKLTPYGELLYKVRIEHNCSTNWMYNLVADSERLDDDITSKISRVIEAWSEP